MQKGAQSSWYKKRGKGHRGQYLGQKPRKVDHYEEIIEQDRIYGVGRGYAVWSRSAGI